MMQLLTPPAQPSRPRQQRALTIGGSPELAECRPTRGTGLALPTARHKNQHDVITG
jgi:hypothetical protein